MQNDSSSTWSTAAPTSGEDFARFLEFHDLDLDLSAFDDQAQVSAQSQDVSDHHGMKQDYDAAAYYDQLHHVAIQKDGSTGDLRGQMTGLHVGSSTHSLSNGYQQQMYYQNRIPPTPSSTDIHGRQSQSLVDAQQASMYEAQVRKQQEQVSSARKAALRSRTKSMNR